MMNSHSLLCLVSSFSRLQMSKDNLQDQGKKVMCLTGQGGCLSTTTTTILTSYVVETGCGNLVEDNTRYKGTANIKTIKDGSTIDFESCAQECADFAGCNFWTFTDSGNCHLKTSDDGREKKEGFTSGQRPCGWSVTTDYNIYIYNLKIQIQSQNAPHCQSQFNWKLQIWMNVMDLIFVSAQLRWWHYWWMLISHI